MNDLSGVCANMATWLLNNGFFFCFFFFLDLHTAKEEL